MVSLRLRSAASTGLLVAGAALVGDALHGAVVTGAYPATSPPAVLRVVAGAVLLAVGYRLSDARAAYARSVVGRDGERAGDAADAEYDPEMSPFPGPGSRDADAAGDPDASRPTDAAGATDTGGGDDTAAESDADDRRR